MYFQSKDSTTNMELWASDGTLQGTAMVAELYPGPGPSYPDNMVATGTGIYFTARKADAHQAVYFSDGTTAGTQIVCSTSLDGQLITSATKPFRMALVDGSLFFPAKSETKGRELHQLQVAAPYASDLGLGEVA